MLAIPLHSQSTSMAEIVKHFDGLDCPLQRTQKKSKAGFALEFTSTATSTLGFISPKKHKLQDEDFGYK
ncbi:hypothetical protein Tco_0299519 [Tanacetum coccineum]